MDEKAQTRVWAAVADCADRIGAIARDDQGDAEEAMNFAQAAAMLQGEQVVDLYKQLDVLRERMDDLVRRPLP